MLIPTQYIFASIAFSSTDPLEASFPPLSAYAVHKPSVLGEEKSSAQGHQASALVQACALTSGTLLLVGILAQIRISDRALDRRKKSDHDGHAHATHLLNMQSLQKMIQSILSVGLPIYAAMHLGGARVGLLMLAAFTSPLFVPGAQKASFRHAFVAVQLLCMLADMTGLTLSASVTSLFLGYGTLLLCFFVVPPSLPVLGPVAGDWSGSARPSSHTSTSTLIASVGDITNTLVAGTVLATLTVIGSMIASVTPAVSFGAVSCATISIALAAALIFFGQPAALRTSPNIGLAIGCLVSAASSFLFSPSVWPGAVINGGICAIAYVGTIFQSQTTEKSHDHHDHVHTGHSQKHQHLHHGPTDVSGVTSFLLSKVQRGSLIYDVLCEKDSRRIAYFTW